MNLLYKASFIIVLDIMAANVIAQTNFPTIGIENKSVTSGFYHVIYPGDIISPTTPKNPVNVSGTGKVQFQSGRTVKLKNGFQASGLNSGGYFKAKAGGPFEVEIMTDDGIDVPKFEKFELGIKLPSEISDLVDQFLLDNFNSAPNPQGINPYNPEWSTTTNGISLEMELTSPSGIKKTKFGFYMREYTNDEVAEKWTDQHTDYSWRFRIAPDELGKWSGSIRVDVSGGKSIQDEVAFDFNCIENTDYVHDTRKGFLKVGSSQRYLTYSGTDETFFALGENIAKPSDVDSKVNSNWLNESLWKMQPKIRGMQERLMQQLSDAGGNYYRMWVGNLLYGVEHEKLGVYDKYIETESDLLGDYGLGGINVRDRQTDAAELDYVLESARDKNLHIQMCIDVYGHKAGEPEVSFNPYYWKNSPYRNELGLDLVPAEAYFSDPGCKSFFQRKLRYFIARWGYSTNLGVIEFVNEIDNSWYYDNVPNYENGPSNEVIKIWLRDMSSYIKNDLDHNDHLLSTTKIDKFTDLYEHLDVIGFSDYNMKYNKSKEMTERLRSNLIPPKNSFGIKPIITAEMGMGHGFLMHTSQTTNFHNLIWSTAFMGGYGAGLEWTYAVMHSLKYKYFPDGGTNPIPPTEIRINDLKHLSNFVKGVDFNEHNFMPHLYWETTISSGKFQAQVEISIGANYLVSSDSEYVIGWAFNRTNWWGNPSPDIYDAVKEAVDGGGTDGVPFPLPFTHFFNNDKWWEAPYALPLQTIEITNLKPNSWVDIDWYSTKTDLVVLSQDNIFVSATGIITVWVPPTNELLGWDYSFKVYPHGKSFRLKPVEETNSDLSENESLFSFSVIPNPNNGEFVISTSSEMTSVTVTDMWGKEVYNNQSVSASRVNVDLSIFSRGIYIVMVTQGETTTFKRVVYQ